MVHNTMSPTLAPLPPDYDSALIEIIRLRTKIIEQNKMLADMYERNGLLIREHRAEMSRVVAENTSLRKAENDEEPLSAIQIVPEVLDG